MSMACGTIQSFALTPSIRGESAVAPDIEAQQYVLYDGVSDEIKKGNVTYWHGLKNDVLYRRQFFNYDLENECHWIQAMNLADFTVPYGVIRADKLRLFSCQFA